MANERAFAGEEYEGGHTSGMPTAREWEAMMKHKYMRENNLDSYDTALRVAKEKYATYKAVGMKSQIKKLYWKEAEYQSRMSGKD